MSRRVAVVGATGAVGTAMLAVLAERGFPVSEIHALATPRSAGTPFRFHGVEGRVESVEGFDFSRVDLALFAGGEVASSVYAPRARNAGALVVDNSATFRMEPDVPLVVPEVNPQHLDSGARLIANPNC
ncbi:MAG: aspartate-semialdehyde dehydrogenase, partial [Candidatus Eremiobacterota bacterium]